MKRTRAELAELQSLPLGVKVEKTKKRIKEWVEHYGEDGVYVSFSGGKDSTVLLHIARELYPNLKGVFCDTGLEYPEIRNFVRTFDNIDWLKPKKNFKQIINQYGYPLISKEIAECIGQSRKYFEKLYELYVNSSVLNRERERANSDDTYVQSDDIMSKQEFFDSRELKELLYSRPPRDGARHSLSKVIGIYDRNSKTNPNTTDENRSPFCISPKWRKLMFAPFDITSYCCSIMKKNPAHEYAKKTGRKMISGQMASESRQRTDNWITHGCNAFNLKSPVSNPMSFWTEQDVLLYLKKYNVPYCSVYGDIVDEEGNDIDLTNYKDNGLFESDRPLLHTTGAYRTGCMFCGFGCHLDKEPRFVRLKRTHPKQYEYIMKPKSEGGLGYKEVIDWLNENCGTDIKY